MSSELWCLANLVAAAIDSNKGAATTPIAAKSYNTLFDSFAVSFDLKDICEFLIKTSFCKLFLLQN